MRTEVNTGDMKVRQPPPIDLSLDKEIGRDSDILLVEKQPKSDYLDDLAFMEEPVTIRLERPSEKFAPNLMDFYVNGRAQWVPVGQPCTVARKYVEVMARSQPYDVQTQTGTTSDENPENRVIRYQKAKYPFSVLKDTPKGLDWLTRIMQES